MFETHTGLHSCTRLGVDCRAELVSGRSQPTAQELSGYQGPSSTQKGVPRFWLTALKAEVRGDDELDNDHWVFDTPA
jgi:hypothetical protein